jgi:hypothetical protein
MGETVIFLRASHNRTSLNRGVYCEVNIKKLSAPPLQERLSLYTCDLYLLVLMGVTLSHGTLILSHDRTGHMPTYVIKCPDWA